MAKEQRIWGVALLILWIYLFNAALLVGSVGLVTERPPCNYTLSSLSSLHQDAESKASWQSLDVVICVDLQPGNEYLDYSSTSIDLASVVITGSATGSVVQCRINESQTSSGGELELDDYTRFPLVFTNSSLVIIEGVQFERCQRPLQFKQVTRVEFISSSFRDFYPGGTLDISNSPQVFVNNCTFTNNTSLGIGRRRFSGNAGAIAIGYNDGSKTEVLQSIPPFIRVTRSTFRQNNSTAAEEFQYDAAQVLSRRIYNQRGAAIACYLGSSNYSADIEINGCTFESNYVRDSGGAVYMFLTGQNNGHSVKFRQCDVVGNTASVGGGIELTFDTSLTNSSQELILNHVLLEDCNFTRNIGRYGGGYSHIQINRRENLNNLTIRNCIFIENTAPVGSAIYLQYVFTVNHALLKKMIFVEDCTFLDNTAAHGVLFASRNTVAMLGNTTFKRCLGPAIQSFGSLITFGGHLLFDSNRNHPEGFSGVIHLAAFGQILLSNGVNMTFTNNTGAKGGAIAVTGQLVASGSTKQLYNPQCFLQYEYPRIPPPFWNVNMLFVNNQATVGPIVYTSNLQVCTWFTVNSPFFNNKPQDGWTFMMFQDNYLVRGKERISKPDNNFQTIVKSFTLADNQESVVTASPGESLTISVIAYDEYDHETTGFLELQDDKTTDPVIFEPSVVQSVAGVGQITFSYLSSYFLGNTTALLLPTFTNEQLNGTELTLIHSPCLLGHFLREKRCICEETTVVALCLPREEGVILASDLWGSPPNWSLELVTYTCPPGYCDCSQGFGNEENIGCLLNYTNPDDICIETRTDLLCGQCIEGYGVGLLTNECKQFTDRLPQFWLFPIYFGILIPLLVVIVRFGVHLPTILRGFIFYVQISPIAVEYLPQSFRLRTDVMSCIASTLALYVPYDFNFHEGMTSLESYGLRYVTPLVALVVVPIAAGVGTKRSKCWFGMWTIIQLLYIMATNTSVSLLLCARLTRTVASSTSAFTLNAVNLWFYDGSVECYRGWHILLAITALLSLMTLGILILLVAAALHFKILRKRVHPSFEKLEPFSDALTKGFKKEYYWWPMTELACRYCFILSVVLSVGNKTAPLFLSVLFFLAQFYHHPYEDKLSNYMESFVLSVLVLLLGLGNTIALTDTVKNIRHFTLWPIFYLPVFVGGITTIVYIVYQIWLSCKKKKQSNKWLRRQTQKFGEHRSVYRRRVQRQVTRSEVSFDHGPEDEETEDMADNDRFEIELHTPLTSIQNS